jgi:hypothetical protein
VGFVSAINFAVDDPAPKDGIGCHPQDEGAGAWTCMAKVKGLNPPGRKQSHPQGVALCE